MRYGDSVFTFFALDDFWLLRDATSLHIESVVDVARLFRFNHMGFHLYRPLTQAVYFFALQRLFGTDASGFHLAQLAAFCVNALLVLAIARRVSGSLLTGLCAALLYVAAPGHAVAVFWIAAFTMTGTALAVFLLLLWWQRSSGTSRVIGSVLLQVVALLCSEHAVVAPALLVAVSIFGPIRERWRAVCRDVAGPVAVVAVYLLLKLAYFASVGWPWGGYRMAADRTAWLTNVGRYTAATLNLFALNGLSEEALPWLGAAVCAVALVATVCALRWNRWRLLALGTDVFLIALLPVLPLTAHYYDYFIGVAALGAVLAWIGLLALIVGPCRVGPLAAIATLLVLGQDARNGDAVARSNEVFRLCVNAATGDASFLTNLHLIRASDPLLWVLVPRNEQTESVIGLGHAGDVFFDPPLRVLLMPPAQLEAQTTFQVYLPDPSAYIGDQGLPFWWKPRLDWIRLWVPLARLWYVDTFVRPLAAAAAPAA